MYNDSIAGGTRRLGMALAFCTASTVAVAQPYYPNMVYSAKEQLAPGVTYQTGSQSTPSAQKVYIFEIDMSNPNVELRPVFKTAGDVGGSSNELTSSMALRTDGVAAVNAGYYNVTAGENIRKTNSYTEIDGIYIGGSANNSNLAENNRSVVAFSGDHQAFAMRTKLGGSSGLPSPSNPTDWARITDAIAGRGHFVTSEGVVTTQDNENTGTSHYDARHPRTAIGFTEDPYTAWLVAVDGRDADSVGMSYTELARLMADLGIEQSISLDGGGSTTAWTKEQGVVNDGSDGSERAVASAWVVVVSNTMDNTVTEVSSSGSWTTDTTALDKYHTDHLVTDDTQGSASVTWSPDLEQDGEYRVYAWWAADANRADAAPYEIVHADGSVTVEVDQTQKGGQWNLLGNYPFHSGTGGTVTLSNADTGTVSADGVRFVRYRDVQGSLDDDYTVTGTLFQADFESDQSGNFTVSHQASQADNSIDFSYDYSTFSQQGGLNPASIPQSPGSTGNGTTALRVATNVSAGAVNGITATLNSIPGQQNVRITFDAWMNYNGPSGGGAGSTEFMSFGASAVPTNVAAASSSYSGTNEPFSGFYFATTGEGGAADDYRYYDGNGGNAIGNNASRVNYLGTAATNMPDFGQVFPFGHYETNGATGKAWLTWEVIVLDGEIRLSAIKPDGSQTVLADWFTPNASATLAGLLPHFGTFDPFSSLANPASDNFVLYDNLKVESIAGTGQTSVHQWPLY